MKCWDCQEFKIQYEPIGNLSHGIWDLGRAKCMKHNLVVDFVSHKTLKKIECVEKDGKDGHMFQLHRGDGVLQLGRAEMDHEDQEAEGTES